MPRNRFHRRPDAPSPSPSPTVTATPSKTAADVLLEFAGRVLLPGSLPDSLPSGEGPTVTPFGLKTTYQIQIQGKTFTLESHEAEDGTVLSLDLYVIENGVHVSEATPQGIANVFGRYFSPPGVAALTWRAGDFQGAPTVELWWDNPDGSREFRSTVRTGTTTPGGIGNNLLAACILFAESPSRGEETCFAPNPEQASAPSNSTLSQPSSTTAPAQQSQAGLSIRFVQRFPPGRFPWPQDTQPTYYFEINGFDSQDIRGAVSLSPGGTVPTLRREPGHLEIPIESGMLPRTFTITVTTSMGSASTTFEHLPSHGSFAADNSCEAFPPEVSPMMSVLKMPEGLCLIREAPTGPSEYWPGRRTIYLRSPASQGGLIHVLAHELCHAHQHAVILERSSFFDDSYPSTPEGDSFVQLTGWHLENVGWVRSAQSNFTGYPNPVEDSAETCAQWYFPASPDYLRTASPERHQWATQWLPK